MNKTKILTLFLTLVLTLGLSINVIGAPSEDYTEGTEMDIRPVMTDIPPKPQWLKDLEIKDPQPTMAIEDIPSQFSWLDYNGDWTTPAKDQASCGSCWAFGALGAMEAVINIASGYHDLDIDLSEQYVLSCLGSAGSCSGGWMSEVYIYGQSTASGSSGNGINGIIVEDCMPYQAVDWIPCSDKCSDWDYFTDPPAPDNNLFEIQDYGVATFNEDSPSDWMTIKSWIMTYGPITCDIYQSSGLSSWANSHHDPNDVYQNDDSGITNHAQVICGWKDDPNIVNGGYWILKNSWGTGYGYNGFVNLAYGCNSLCTRDTSWVQVTQWPQQSGGPGPGDFDMGVFCDFDYGPEYPLLGEAVTFSDISDGDVTLREWDFNGDGVIDSNEKSPTYIYYQEGEYTVTLNVTNAWGLKSTRTLVVEVREIWPPEAVINPEEFVDDELEVAFDGRFSYDVDGGRITSYHWDFDDGTTSDESNILHVFPEADRIYNVKLTVSDDDGASATTTCVVKIDQTMPPETQIILDLGADQSEWYRFNKIVRFEAEDWTGVSDTFYRINGGEWLEYQESQNVVFSQEGNNQVDYYSVDYYGNEEQVKSAIIRIDKTMPTLDISVNGQKADNWYTSDVSVSMIGDDSLSGLDLIIYKVDTGSWKEYNSGFTLADGQHRIWAYAIDKAGNRFGSDDPMLVNVDTGSPTTVCQLVGEGTSKDFYKSVNVRLIADDDGSGVETIYYKLNGGGFEEYTSDNIIVDEPGDYTVDFYAVDALGNEEAAQSRTFSVHSVNFKMILDQPQNFLYLFNVELFGLGRPVIIGPVDIAVEVDCFAGVCADISYVEFLVDGEVMIPDSTEPYIWRLDTPLMGSHEIGVRAVASDGSMVEEFVDAQVFIF